MSYLRRALCALFLTIYLGISLVAICLMAGPLLAQLENPLDQPTLKRVASDRAFLFDTPTHTNFLGYLSAGEVLPWCAGENSLCSLAGVPGPFLKAGADDLKEISTESRSVSGALPLRWPAADPQWPELDKIELVDSEIRLAFNGGVVPGVMLWPHGDSARSAFLISPARSALRFIMERKGALTKREDLTLTPQGELGWLLSLPVAGVYGFSKKEISPGVLAISVVRKATKPFVLVLDPGHGGAERGVCPEQDASRPCESWMVLEIAKEVARILKERDSGLEVRLTREDDSELKLVDRVKMAESIGANLFISLHIDAWPEGGDVQPAPKGISSYYFTSNSRAAALKLCHGLTIGKLSCNAVFQRSFMVLHSMQFPSLLLELGNLEDPSDRRDILTEEFRKRAGKALAEQIYDLVKTSI